MEHKISRTIIALASLSFIAAACVQSVDISRFVSEISGDDKTALDKHLPESVVIAVGQRTLVPELQDGVNPITTNVYPALGGLIATSSNEAVVKIEKKDDSSFYIIGVAQGQATVHVRYVDYNRTIPVAVEQTLVNTIYAPRDYRGHARDSVILPYYTYPRKTYRQAFTVTSDNENIRAFLKGDNVVVIADAPGTAGITISASNTGDTFSFVADRRYADSVRFEIPVDHLKNHIEDYRFNISNHVIRHLGINPETLEEAVVATTYPGIPNDYYAYYYDSVPADFVIRRSAAPYDMHVGVYPLNTTDCFADLRIISVRYVAGHDGEYGPDGTLIGVSEDLWYKYFSLVENSGSGRFNDYTVTPLRPCILRFRATAGGMEKEFILDFRMDADSEPDTPAE